MLNRSRGRGFTLIELLVVMAIIIMIAGLLTPGLMKARQQANKVSCANNLKQVSLGLEMYATANSGVYPDKLNKLTFNYIDDNQAIQCPLDGAYDYTQPTNTTLTTDAIAWCKNSGLANNIHGSGAGVWLYKGGYVKIK